MIPEALTASLTTLLFVLTALAALPCAYLLLLTLLSARLPPAAPSGRRLAFDVIVPAHDEAGGIERTIRNLLELDWPRDRFRVLVVADNCSDATAALAAAAGAKVLVRVDPERRGKGYALACAFEASRAAGFADAIVVVDADSMASRNLLEALASRIERGAAALQAHYGVLNVDASWRTRLMAIALGAIHTLRSRGRERLGLSCGIRGNGWCVTRALLEAVPYRAFSLTEDIEFGVELGLRDIRVEYCEAARIDGEMVTSERAARTQRQRWEGGRLALIRGMMPRLSAAVLRGSRICLDLGLDLLVPPLSYLALLVLLAGAAGAAAWRLGGPHAPSWIAVADVAILVLYVLRGWALSGTGSRGLLDLLRAPGFVLWKVMLMIFGKRAAEWVRTDREAL